MSFKSFVEALLYFGNQKAGTATHNAGEDKLLSEILNWSELIEGSPSFMAHLMPCKFIFDYKKSEMIYFSPSVIHLIGIEQSAFLGANGIIRFMDQINPNDFKVYNEQIFPKDMYFLTTLPYQETIGMIFSNNFRMKQSNGLYKTLLMKKSFITDPETRLPLYELGLLMDISAFKKELSITHTIERFDKSNDFSSFMKVVTEDYFPEMHASILSAREKEILTHLSMGTKRKEVGIKLFISDNTVANHIKTILRKTHSQNIREAIAICKMNGII